MGRRNLGELRTYVSVPTQPYFIVEVPGEEPLTSTNILEFLDTQALVSVQNTALDIGQVLMRGANEKSIASMRNLVKATSERYRRRLGLTFLLPNPSASEDEVLKLVVAILQDTPNEHSSDLVEQTSRDDMSPMAHGEYILVVYDGLMGDLVTELIRLFAGLLQQHDAEDSIRPTLDEIVHQYRAMLRGYLRRFGVWV
jgi:hypothetical protein